MGVYDGEIDSYMLILTILKMKKAIKVYLESADEKNLKQKAEVLFGNGRGIVSKYIEKISREPVVFIDDNVLKVLAALNLVPK